MNKLVRGLVTGSLVGAAVGVAMLAMKKKRGMTTNMNLRQANRVNQQARGTISVVKDNAMRWSAAVKNGTEAFSRRLARRAT